VRRDFWMAFDRIDNAKDVTTVTKKASVNRTLLIAWNGDF